MAASVADAFAALGRLSPDEAWAARVQKRVAAALGGPAEVREDALAAVFLAAERDLVTASGGRFQAEDVHRQLRPAFAPVLPDYPRFALLFETPERQLVAVADELLRTWGREVQGLLGPAATGAMIRRALEPTAWKNLEVSVEKGISWDPVRFRTVSEGVGMAAALFEGLYRGAEEVIGREMHRHAFERAFAAVSARYRWLPAMRNLIGATPLEVLALEKARRLHELETETVSQELGLRVADVGLRRQAENLQRTVEELESTKRHLEAASQAKSAFIDVVSHQFRTPLSSVRWNAEILSDELASQPKVAQPTKEAVESIRIKSVYLIETLDRVFVTLEIDSGTLALDRRPAFLWEIIQNVRDQFEREIKAKKISWKFVRSKEQVREIPLDKAKIETVLKIVCGNAIAYASDGGNVTVNLAPETVNGLDYLVCSVTDDGLGLPVGDKARFFDKFFRSKAAVLKIADGTGLGNYIVKHVIEAHKGWVGVESAGEGRGVTVRFGLPVA